MGTYYKFEGRLRFADAKAAQDALAELCADANAPYWVPDGIQQQAAIVDGDELVISDGDFGSTTFYKTYDALERVAARAIGGAIEVQDGDGSDGTEYFEIAPRRVH